MRARTQPALKIPPAPSREVRCYHCARRCQVSARAMSSSCPHCHNQLCVADIVVRERHWGTRIQTCGVVRVEPGADVRVKVLVASRGVEIHGRVHARIVSYGPVTIGETGSIDGDLEAPAVHVAPGATIAGGRFAIAPAPPAA